MLLVGLISDTHGLLREEALEALADSDVILHAGDVGGDVGGKEILSRLDEIAPVHAVRGNVDSGPGAGDLPPFLSLKLERVELLLHHGHLQVPALQRKKAGVIIQGHSHRPLVRRDGGKLYVNPGSAGRRRFRLPVTVALLRVDGDDADAELVHLT